MSLAFVPIHVEMCWKVTEKKSHEIYTNSIDFDAVAMAMGSENLFKKNNIFQFLMDDTFFRN